MIRTCSGFWKFRTKSIRNSNSNLCVRTYYRAPTGRIADLKSPWNPLLQKAASSLIVVRTTDHFTETCEISLLSPKEPCTSKATGWKMYPLSINSRYFSISRASASVAVVPGLHKEPSFRRLDARASRTVTSHTSCLLISQGIMVTPSGRLPSVRYSPRGSSIEGKSRYPNVCFLRELRVAWREKRPALLVQERPCKPSCSTPLPQWHVCPTQQLAPRRKQIEIRSCWSSSFRPRFLQGTTFSHWDPNSPWWALKTFERLSSILEIKSWAVLTKTGCVHFFWVPSRGPSCSFVKLNHFSSAFVNETTSNVSEKIVVRKSLAPKAEAKNAGSANNDEDDTPRPPISAGRAS